MRRGAVPWFGAALLTLLAGCGSVLPPLPAALTFGRARVHGELRVLDAPAPGFADLGAVVVYLEPADRALRARWAAPARVFHRDEGFTPELLVVEPGQSVRVANEGGIHHRIFWLSEDAHVEVDLPPAGSADGAGVEIALAQQGVSRFYCELHQDESFRIFAAPSPHFARLDASGPFAIEGVPPGAWRLHVWSETVAGPIRDLHLTRQDSQQDIWIDPQLGARSSL